jgi:hypothetical protein
MTVINEEDKQQSDLVVNLVVNVLDTQRDNVVVNVVVNILENENHKSIICYDESDEEDKDTDYKSIICYDESDQEDEDTDEEIKYKTIHNESNQKDTDEEIKYKTIHNESNQKDTDKAIKTKTDHHESNQKDTDEATDHHESKQEKIQRLRAPKKLKKDDEMTIISPQQIKASHQIVESFIQERRWTILTAQMQSGKTTTYYLTAFIMLMLQLVNKVIIFSGNNEIELKNQVKESKDKFLKSLKNEKNLIILTDIINNYINKNYINNYDTECDRARHIRESFDNFENNVEVLWGGRDMEKYECSQDDYAFYIWDESHYAQNKGMCSENFLTSQGIYAHGNQANLEENNCYMLSVSATPFSEISDNKHQNQNKTIVNLEVDDEKYHGVKKMVQNRLIHSYNSSKWKTHLSDTLRRHASNSPSPKYALLRLRDSLNIRFDEVMKMIEECGWKYKLFDSSKSSQLNKIQDLENEPEENTVIVMKGKCRMGKVVPKKFVAFCMETSKNPKTDVILQGLLGRMCGYHSYNNIEIHLSDNVVKSTDGSTEFERYVRYIESNDVIPRKANNIVFGKTNTRSTLHPIIPIRIRLDEPSQNICVDIRAIFNEIYTNAHVRVYNANVIKNLNNREQSNELIQRLAFMNRNVIIKRINGQVSYESVPRLINESITTRTPKSLGSSCGIKAEDSETIVIWVFENNDYEDDYDIRRGDMFIDARTILTSREMIRTIEGHKKIPSTTGKETFDSRQIVN